MKKCPRCNGSLVYNKLTSEYYCLFCGYTQGGSISCEDGLSTNYVIFGHCSSYRLVSVHTVLTGSR